MKRKNFAKLLSNLFSSSKVKDPHGYWIYVRCNRCGEEICTRINLHNDLSSSYHDKGTIYICRKVLMGQKLCFQRVEVNLIFDDKRKLLEQEISGGTFIDRGEFSTNQKDD